MSVRIIFCAAVALLAISDSITAAQVPVAPIEYRVGAIPVPYVPFDFTAYRYTTGSIADISDSSLQTYTRLQGLDSILQSNGASVDTGTFYLLKYQIDPAATEFRIDFTARNEPYPFTPYGDFLIVGLSPDGVTSTDLQDLISAQTPTTFGISIFRNSDSGNFPWSPTYGLSSMLNPDGTLRVVLNGAFGAAIDQSGFVTTYLYDVRASYTVVPEPASLLLLAAGAVPMILGRCKRREVICF